MSQIIYFRKMLKCMYICKLGHIPSYSHNINFTVFLKNYDTTMTFLFFLNCIHSPGRSPSCCDHEIIMMNHVYKERFPKVSVTYFHQSSSLLSDCIFKGEFIVGLYSLPFRPQLRWRSASRRSFKATPLRMSCPWLTVSSASHTIRSLSWPETAWKSPVSASLPHDTSVSSRINWKGSFRR